jgi:hypothetical protein
MVGIKNLVLTEGRPKSRCQGKFETNRKRFAISKYNSIESMTIDVSGEICST